MIGSSLSTYIGGLTIIRGAEVGKKIIDWAGRNKLKCRSLILKRIMTLEPSTNNFCSTWQILSNPPPFPLPPPIPFFLTNNIMLDGVPTKIKRKKCTVQTQFILSFEGTSYKNL